MITALAMLAGGVGAAARFIVDGTLRRHWPGRLPVGTLVINLLGALLLGLLAGAAARGSLSGHGLLIAGTGFCGGFTTFSTAVLDAARLLQERHSWLAVGYLAGMAVGAVALAWIGLSLG